MEAFLSIILFLFLGFWLIGIIGRWALRAWVAKRQKDFGQRFSGGYSAWGGGKQQRKEGEVTITKKGDKTGRSVSEKVGEYVPFEEYEVREKGDITDHK